MKNIFKKLFFPVLIALLFFSTVVAFFSTIIIYHKTILRSVGVYIQDDCHFEGISAIECSFIDISDRNSFFFHIKNLNLRISPEKIFSKEFIKLSLDYIDGKIIPKKEKKKKSKKVSLKPVFFFLNNSSINIKKVNIHIHQKKPIFIENLSLFTENKKISILKPFSVYIDKEKITISDINGYYDTSKLTIKKFLLKSVYGSLKGSVSLDIYGDFSGRFDINSKKIQKVITAENINGSFFIKGDINEGFLLKGRYQITSIQKNDIFLREIEGKTEVLFRNFPKGKNSLYVTSLKGKNFSVRGIKLDTDWIFKQFFRSKNILTIKNLGIAHRRFKYISSVFSVERDKFLNVKGKAFYRKLKVEYTALLNNKPELTVKFPDYPLREILKDLDVQNKLVEQINLFIGGKYSLDLKTLKGKGEFSLSKIDIFGLSFDKGSIKVRNDIKKQWLSLNGVLEDKSRFFKISGNIEKKYLKANVRFSDIDISNLYFTKSYGIKGIFSGEGEIKGNIPDISVSLKGNIPSFQYKKLILSNIDYSFFYKNKNVIFDTVIPDINISAHTQVSLKPFSLTVEGRASNGNLKPFYPFLVSTFPDAFKQVKPEKATGQFKLVYKKDFYQIDIDIKKSKIFLIPAKDFMYTSIKGNIKKRKIDIKVSFYKNKFRYRNKAVFDNIKGLFILKNSIGNLNIEVSGLDKADKFHLFSALVFDLRKKSLDGDVFTNLKLKEYRLTLNTNLTGNFESFKGTVFTEIYLKDKKFTENFLNYTFKKDKKGFLISFKSKNFDIFINDTFETFIKNPNGYIKVGENLTGKVKADYVVTYQSGLTLFKTTPINITITDKFVRVAKLDFEGLVSGKISSILYSFSNNFLSLTSEGKLDKQLLSEIIQFGTVNGWLNYSLSYKGDLENPLQKLYLKLFSENLSLRSSYLRGFLRFNKVFAVLKRGKASIDIEGKTSSVLSGESRIKFLGEYNLKNSENLISLKAKLLPVRYIGIFEGSLNSDIKSFSKEKKQYIKGDISLSGRLRADPDMKEKFKGSSSGEEKGSSTNLEKIVFDLKVKTFSPIYIYGKWGNAYGEGQLTIEGTAKKPVVNGYINIVYGKINYMKNRYNIDYAKIKIINNKPYISARISTVVANTFIYVNINGSLENPNLSFTSIPPKPKNEILSILLFKDAPGALENIPLFTAIGKIIYAFLPFGTEEDRGLFNTGFNVTILPSYNPLYGITASIYARKNITRRFYIAFSRPVKEVEGINIFGWYEIGLNITEDTSIKVRWYENNDEEVHIMFSLPFDF